MTKNELTDSQQQLAISKIKKELFDILKENENSRTFNFKSIGDRLLAGVPEVITLKGVTGNLDYFEHVYYVKKLDPIASSGLDRKEIIKNSFSIGRDEFIDLGQVNVTFEVQVN